MSDVITSDAPTAPTKKPPRLKTKYAEEIKGNLQQQLGLTNVMQVPALTKIVINMGVGRATQQPSLLEGAVADLTLIAGQKPIVTKARTSIAGAIPRIRDFRGLPPKSWDGRGNYTFGLNDQTVFPEIDYDKIDVPRGMDITIVTTAIDDAAGKALLDAFGFPFRTVDDPNAPAPKARRRGPVRGGKRK